MDDRIVEAVARAICAGNPDDCVFGTAGTHEPAVCHTRRWETYKSAARAAITAFQAEAFKEPTAWAEEYGKAGVVSVSLRRGAFHHVPLYRLPPAPKASP